MLRTIIKALEVDFRNADNERYLRSNTNISQNLARILAIRKHYPEFKAEQTLMFPKLAELSRLTRAEGLCLSYWHDCGGEVSEFKSALGNRSEVTEAAILAARPSRFKAASLSRYMQRGEDTVLLNYLSDSAKVQRIDVKQRELNTQPARQQITGLLYNLRILDEQLHTMIERRSKKISFAPSAQQHQYAQVQFAPDNSRFVSNSSEPHNAAAHNRASRYMPQLDLQKYNVMPQFAPSKQQDSFIPPISFDNGPIDVQAQSISGSHRPFDSNGPIDIWYNLAEDANTPRRFLVWLSENQNPYVSQRALATLKKQDEKITAAPTLVQRQLFEFAV